MGSGLGEKSGLEEMEEKALVDSTTPPSSSLYRSAPIAPWAAPRVLPSVARWLEPLTFRVSVSAGGSIIPKLPVISRRAMCVSDGVMILDQTI